MRLVTASIFSHIHLVPKEFRLITGGFALCGLLLAVLNFPAERSVGLVNTCSGAGCSL